MSFSTLELHNATEQSYYVRSMCPFYWCGHDDPPGKPVAPGELHFVRDKLLNGRPGVNLDDLIPTTTTDFDQSSQQDKFGATHNLIYDSYSFASVSNNSVNTSIESVSDLIAEGEDIAIVNFHTDSTFL